MVDLVPILAEQALLFLDFFGVPFFLLILFFRFRNLWILLLLNIWIFLPYLPLWILLGDINMYTLSDFFPSVCTGQNCIGMNLVLPLYFFGQFLIPLICIIYLTYLKKFKPIFLIYMRILIVSLGVLNFSAFIIAPLWHTPFCSEGSFSVLCALGIPFLIGGVIPFGTVTIPPLAILNLIVISILIFSLSQKKKAMNKK